MENVDYQEAGQQELKMLYEQSAGISVSPNHLSHRQVKRLRNTLPVTGRR